MRSCKPGSLGLVCRLLLCLLIVAATAVSCSSRTDYTPKPRGYFRIEPPVPSYVSLPLDELPYSFNISSEVTVELPPVGDPVGWINLAYPSLGAKIYCSYIPIRKGDLHTVMEESRSLVIRQSRNVQSITEQAYDNDLLKVYAVLFQLEGNTPSPIQFTVTDSATRFFRGALYYNRVSNIDSLAPVTQYVKADIMELIQSFSWQN